MRCQKLTGLLSICRKAGKMAMGFDPMLEALSGSKVSGVITAEDISPKTYKEVCFHCGKKQIPVQPVPLTQAEIGCAAGRKAAVVAILDRGFFDRMQTLCEEAQQQ